MKRGYFVIGHKDEDEGVPVVAHTAKEAKKIGYEDLWHNYDWIDLRVRYIKDADVKTLEYGIIRDTKLAMHHGLCGLYDKCESCGTETELYSHDKKALCDFCMNDDHA